MDLRSSAVFARTRKRTSRKSWFATAYAWMANSAEVLMIGADAIFTKPIDIPALVTLVESLLPT